MLSKKLVIIFVVGLLSSIIISLFIILFKKQVLCIDDTNCNEAQHCSAFFCENRKKPIPPPPKLSESAPVPTLELPMETWCQKSCEYNRLSTDELKSKYGLSLLPSTFDRNQTIIQDAFATSYEECFNSVKIDDAHKRNHCIKSAHSACVMKCENEKLESREFHPEDPPFHYCKDVANSKKCLTDVQESTTGWHCICYREQIESQEYEMTSCRRKADECESLQEKVLWTSKVKAIVPDSLLRECTYVSTVFPWRNGQSDFRLWEASKYTDKENKTALQSYRGCLLSGGTRSFDELIEIKRQKKKELFERVYADFMNTPSDENFINCMIQQIPEPMLVLSRRNDKLTRSQFQKNISYCRQGSD